MHPSHIKSNFLRQTFKASKRQFPLPLAFTTSALGWMLSFPSPGCSQLLFNCLEGQKMPKDSLSAAHCSPPVKNTALKRPLWTFVGSLRPKYRANHGPTVIPRTNMDQPRGRRFFFVSRSLTPSAGARSTRKGRGPERPKASARSDDCTTTVTSQQLLPR